MVTSDIGKKYITKEFKFIPALTTIPADEEDLGPLASDIIKYSKDGKVLSWNWFKFPQVKLPARNSAMLCKVM